MPSFFLSGSERKITKISYEDLYENLYDNFYENTKMKSCIINRFIVSYRNRHIFLKNHAKFALRSSYAGFTKTMTNILRKSAQKVTWIYNAIYEVVYIRKTLENTGFSRVLRLFLKFCKNQITVPSVLRSIFAIPCISRLYMT